MKEDFTSNVALQKLKTLYEMEHARTDGSPFEYALAERINLLISTDFDKLIRLLYQSDINEKRLKNELTHSEGENSGLIIARLVIERELEKIRTRQQYRQDQSKINEDEAW
jgi:hypothetical protein